ncbi:outer membrane lipoprotein carrier protein LolA [Novosphingobium resinovorum]|uniref:Cell envelope biogenesis protein LolA n=1 Tax=Novosphingobium resinovorum TaxID=158500 RepID=A0A1D8A4P3_9SPHN|nr:MULTISPECIES: outer membrane lipoprotein carrier protein LolA [Sphingomonadaceae]AOR77083.1 cell envelope biogenesis protein LolA [Novosphingobium resinovorum]MBF7012476.1 outer membrane lipoprotein carrier protein LolA [Novosphingobium sp. HR1a]WJM27212.1 outer membrane lipoprotein carrier protein LolA [Novosphingobium resinovorum]
MNHVTKTFRSCVSAAALAALSVSAALVPAQAVAAAPDDAKQVEQAVAALRGIGTMKADFVQTDRSGQTVSGVLTMKSPGKIRFQYQPSAKMLIVGDGRALNFIDYEVRQVQRWPIKNSPLGALLDPSRDVAKFGKLIQTGNPGVVSIEVRDRSHPEYGVITLIFTRKASAPGGLELTYWVSLDSQNKRTTISLSNQRYGVPVTDNDFRWNDPRPRNRR